MQYTALGGIKGATFCSTLQLSHRFKMLSWFYSGGFFGNYLCVGKMVASIVQGTSPCAQSERRQRPCCRPLPRWVYFPKWICHLHRSLWSRVLALPSLSGRGFFQLQKQTCQKLWPLRALEFEARLLLPSSIFQNKNLSSESASGGQRDDFPPGSFIFQPPLRQLSKVCACYADACVWKAVFAPRLPIFRKPMYN